MSANLLLTGKSFSFYWFPTCLRRNVFTLIICSVGSVWSLGWDGRLVKKSNLLLGSWVISCDAFRRETRMASRKEKLDRTRWLKAWFWKIDMEIRVWQIDLFSKWIDFSLLKQQEGGGYFLTIPTNFYKFFPRSYLVDSVICHSCRCFSESPSSFSHLPAAFLCLSHSWSIHLLILLKFLKDMTLVYLASLLIMVKMCFCLWFHCRLCSNEK